MMNKAIVYGTYMCMCECTHKTHDDKWMFQIYHILNFSDGATMMTTRRLLCARPLYREGNTRWRSETCRRAPR